MKRLPQGGTLIDRSASVAIQLDGRQIEAYQGDTIGSAIAASGIVVTGRSFKYHRPRGLYCMTGACANCLYPPGRARHARRSAKRLALCRPRPAAGL
jgi:sarcosine oxidase, subunit alpha